MLRSRRTPGAAAIALGCLAAIALPILVWAAQGDQLVGKPAPDFRLNDTAGKAWRLSALKGQKVVVLDFGRTYCAGCQDVVKDLKQIHQAYKDRGVQVFSICLNAEDPKVVHDFVVRLGIPYPVLLDKELAAAQAYGLQTIPFTVIVQKGGAVHWVHTGHPDNYAQLVRQQLDKLLAAR